MTVRRLLRLHWEAAARSTYYFDFYQVDLVIVDEQGMELRDILAAQEEAARAVADFAGDAIRADDSRGHRVARHAGPSDGRQVFVSHQAVR